MLDYFRCSGPFWMQSSLDIYYVFQIHFWHVLLCRSIKMTPQTVTSKIRIPISKFTSFSLFSFLQMWPPFFLHCFSFSLFYFCASEFQFKIWWESERDWGWKWWLTSDLEAFFTSFWKEQAYEVNFLFRLGFALHGW